MVVKKMPRVGGDDGRSLLVNQWKELWMCADDDDDDDDDYDDDDDDDDDDYDDDDGDDDNNENGNERKCTRLQTVQIFIR
ncbi:hypothetical protein HZH66_010015 [Vespula vulgaris]|uniref:Uncharacterized protein n=1 Tax=Vespula vulgaris TaxID=7454 RepID=A0A834MZR0_VESVU|nr:hypothetical protein HZH66_010015 [Vespula vulgaris]